MSSFDIVVPGKLVKRMWNVLQVLGVPLRDVELPGAPRDRSDTSISK
jgi:hypothetical protein